MAPGDERDLTSMLQFALAHDAPVSLRYPKAPAVQIERKFAPIELGRAEVLEWGHDCILIACGAVLADCAQAAATLRAEGMDVGVINARFIKPLDNETVLRAIEQANVVITVEEGALPGGFGSAVLEAAADAGISTAHIRRLGVPDRYIEHGERNELLADLGLDATGIAAAARDAISALRESAGPMGARRHAPSEHSLLPGATARKA
jgi:1-deoxy-D-xylulose-5-phosphate synthase